MKKHSLKKLMMIILLFAAGCQQCLLDSDSQPMIGFNPDSKFTLPNEENISMDINIENLKTGIFGFTFQFEYESSKLEMLFCAASEGSSAFFGQSYISQIFIDPEIVPCETIVTIEDDNQENECKKVYGTFVLENGQDLARGSGTIATCQFETIFSSTANINFIPEKFYFFNEYGIEIPHSYSSDISEQDSIDASIVEFEIINGKVYIDVQSNSFEDIDGNLYHEKQIGDQIWMVENLKVRHYNNGDVIPSGIDSTEWADLDETETGAYAIYPFDDDNASQNTCGDNCADVYGNLYNWYAVNDNRGICPDGWRVPSDLDYLILTDNLGGGNIAGGKMKESAVDHWQEYSSEVQEQTTNESGFTALPGGYRQFEIGNFDEIGYFGHFWTSSENTNEKAWNLSLSYENSSVYWDSNNKNSGYSVRCIKE